LVTRFQPVTLLRPPQTHQVEPPIEARAGWEPNARFAPAPTRSVPTLVITVVIPTSANLVTITTLFSHLDRGGAAP
jgi:hypothetical protein